MDAKKIATVVVSIVLIVILGVVIYIIVRPEDKTYEFEPTDTELTNPNTEAITGDFIDIKYERNNESIIFYNNGEFSYVDNTNNGVDNYNECKYYTYDGEESISFICKSYDNVIEDIKVVEGTNEKLVLDFSGELREFTKVVE